MRITGVKNKILSIYIMTSIMEWCEYWTKQMKKTYLPDGLSCTQVVHIQSMRDEYNKQTKFLKNELGVEIGITKEISCVDVAPEQQYQLQCLIRGMENYKRILDTCEQDEYTQANYIALLSNDTYVPCLFSSDKEEHEAQQVILRKKIEKLNQKRQKVSSNDL